MLQSGRDLRIVQESLAGKRDVNELTFSSLSVLKNKLAGLKAQDERFKDVGFSPDVENLRYQHTAVVTG